METDPNANIASSQEWADEVKRRLADPRDRIVLDDLVTTALKRWLVSIAEDRFSIQSPEMTDETFASRLKDYESVTLHLQETAALLAYWGTADYLLSTRKIVSRVCESGHSQEGPRGWRMLRWYPTVLLIYTAGIAAVASENHLQLACLFLTPVRSTLETRDHDKAILQIGNALLVLDRAQVFQRLPEYARHYAARSEFLYHKVKPLLEKLFFVGPEYEDLFDQFEILLALTHADLSEQKGQGIWGPYGRFAWKYRNRSTNPYTILKADAEQQKSAWAPLKAGFFGGSYDRFEKLASTYQQQLNELPWY